MNKVLIVIAVIIAFGFLGSQGEKSANQTSAVENDSVESCLARGIKYFQDIGSYPTLTAPPNKGRKAEDVALERCKRTTTAF